MRPALLLAAAALADALPALRRLDETCDPMTPPVWSGTTPTPLEVIGFELGTEPV
jgi:hypothetical protein